MANAATFTIAAKQGRIDAIAVADEGIA